MTEKWPTYEVATDDVVHALGVMNINYVRFKRTHVWMMAATGNLTEPQALVFASRVNPTERANFIEFFFKAREWPEPVGPAIKHYIAAMRILTENRNALIHGNIITSFRNEPAIFSLNRKGAMTMFQSSLIAIRRTADDAEMSALGQKQTSRRTDKRSWIWKFLAYLACTQCNRTDLWLNFSENGNIL